MFVVVGLYLMLLVSLCRLRICVCCFLVVFVVVGLRLMVLWYVSLFVVGACHSC